MPIFILPTLFKELAEEVGIDRIDWTVVTRYAERWKLSVADAILDLGYTDESILAKCLGRAQNIPYVAGKELEYDFSEISFENFDDLMSVCAVPVEGGRLAICNPYDDLYGYLGPKFCEREMIITERTAVIEALREFGLNGKVDQKEATK